MDRLQGIPLQSHHLSPNQDLSSLRPLHVLFGFFGPPRAGVCEYCKVSVRFQELRSCCTSYRSILDQCREQCCSAISFLNFRSQLGKRLLSPTPTDSQTHEEVAILRVLWFTRSTCPDHFDRSLNLTDSSYPSAGPINAKLVLQSSLSTYQEQARQLRQTNAVNDSLTPLRNQCSSSGLCDDAGEAIDRYSQAKPAANGEMQGMVKASSRRMFGLPSEMPMSLHVVF